MYIIYTSIGVTRDTFVNSGVYMYDGFLRSKERRGILYTIHDGVQFRFGSTRNPLRVTRAHYGLVLWFCNQDYSGEYTFAIYTYLLCYKIRVYIYIYICDETYN